MALLHRTLTQRALLHRTFPQRALPQRALSLPLNYRRWKGVNTMIDFVSGIHLYFPKSNSSFGHRAQMITIVSRFIYCRALKCGCSRLIAYGGFIDVSASIMDNRDTHYIHHIGHVGSETQFLTAAFCVARY